jgi:hypothetical protein
VLTDKGRYNVNDNSAASIILAGELFQFVQAAQAHIELFDIPHLADCTAVTFAYLTLAREFKLGVKLARCGLLLVPGKKQADQYGATTNRLQQRDPNIVLELAPVVTQLDALCSF